MTDVQKRLLTIRLRLRLEETLKMARESEIRWASEEAEEKLRHVCTARCPVDCLW